MQKYEAGGGATCPQNETKKHWQSTSANLNKGFWLVANWQGRGLVGEKVGWTPGGEQSLVEGLER